MAALTTEILKENLVKILPAVGANQSFFSKLGITNIAASNIDLVRMTRVGPAGIAREGQQKDDTRQNIIDAPVIKFKSIATVQVTKELQLDDEGSALIESLLVQAAQSLLDAPAVALLTGLDLNSSHKETLFDTINLYDNGLEFTTDGDTETYAEAMNKLVFSNGQAGGELVIGGKVWTGLAGATVQGIPGARLFPELSNPRDFHFANTERSIKYEGVDLSNAATNLDGDPVLEKELLAVVGPFSTNIGVTINVNNVKVFYEQWKNINLASLNQDLYLLEADVSMFVLEPHKFNVLKLEG